MRLLSFKLARVVNLLAHYAKGTLSPRLQLLLPTLSFAALAKRLCVLCLSLAVLCAIDR